MLRLPPPIWMLLFLAITAAVSAAFGWPRLPFLPQKFLGGLLILSGISLPAWSIFLFRKAGTEVNPTSVVNSGLVTEGPYRLTRNPMYLGMTMIALGGALWVGAWPMLAAPVAVFLTANFVHIPFEEAKMRRQFPGPFGAYEARVRRWI